MIVLGLDIGTTATKGVAYNLDGAVMASARVDYPIISARPDYLELDPEIVCRAIKQVIGEVSAAVGRGEIRAIASAAVGEAIVPLDNHGRFLFNSITALDSRARKQIESFQTQIEPIKFFQTTGQMPHPITSLAKLLWFRDEAPKVFQSARSFFCWNEILCTLLGVAPAISPSLAARTGMYDIRRETWSDTILAIAGIDPRSLAKVVPSGTVIDRVSGRVATELGLSPGCVLISGGWDQACVALGAGAIAAGTVVNSLGSTDSLNASFSEPRTTRQMFKSRLSCTPHVLKGLFCTVAYSLTGGNLLQWYRNTIDTDGAWRAEQQRTNYFDLMVAEAMTSTHPVWVLPHFVGSGTPHMDALSRGALLGLSLSTSRRDVARGILEGIALEMAQNLENIRVAGIPIKEIRAGSGGARNQFILRLRSNVYGYPIVPLTDTELGCRACAMLALQLCGVTHNVEGLVRDWVATSTPVGYDASIHQYYVRKLLSYKRIYPALRGLNARMEILGNQQEPAPVF